MIEIIQYVASIFGLSENQFVFILGFLIGFITNRYSLRILKNLSIWFYIRLLKKDKFLKEKLAKQDLLLQELQTTKEKLLKEKEELTEYIKRQDSLLQELHLESKDKESQIKALQNRVYMRKSEGKVWRL